MSGAKVSPCCYVAAGCEGQWGHSWETEEQTLSVEQDNILFLAVFLSQVFCGSLKFCSVVGAQVTSWDGDGEVVPSEWQM